VYSYTIPGILSLFDVENANFVDTKKTWILTFSLKVLASLFFVPICHHIKEKGVAFRTSTFLFVLVQGHCAGNAVAVAEFIIETNGSISNINNINNNNITYNDSLFSGFE